MTPPDSELITRVLESDDRVAFGELVVRYQSAVRRFLRHLTRGDAATADDLAQETFVQAYRSLPSYRGRAAFSTWLLGIAHNHFRNARRRERPAGAWTDDAASATEFLPNRTSDLQHDLTAALHELSADEQSALHLSYQQGLSHGEIAAVLGWPLAGC